MLWWFDGLVGVFSVWSPAKDFIILDGIFLLVF